ncbi:acyl CoA:acetate/3-ketoacid CoA transferase [Effusibacillus dendaii]|uniref:Propionate CoA-transferase n=1 Tax=Effusibacillus dendaii TaxID=2743772 RepID=A0A7I8DC16_9BACL|nr:CoA-transferase [Effusibacillus dendaii]BCJ86519.1 propionate CoA-transferase [Effusibacillus dendaii]
MEILSAKQAAEKIPDGATVLYDGYIGFGHPEELTKAIAERFRNSGHPHLLTVIHAAGQGDGKDRGMNHFAQPGMIKRIIGSHFSMTPKLAEMIVSGEIEAFALPQGVMCHLYRETAAKRPGLFSKIGLHTYVDPRLEGAKCNDRTEGQIVELTEWNGEEYLFYRAFQPDVAVLRGTFADTAGNISQHKEALSLDVLPIAQAVRNHGGIVIVQVESVAAQGSIQPREVAIPGDLVDYVVVAQPENHKQTWNVRHDPRFYTAAEGEVDYPVLPFDIRKVIARRGALELTPNKTHIFGIGIPDSVLTVAAEEGVASSLSVYLDSGAIGGVPATGLEFGAAFNPTAILPQHQQFDFIHGGGIHTAFLGMAQADSKGNVNVSKFNGQLIGAGGFIDIAHSCRKVVFMGTFTAAGLKVELAEGRLRIVQEGRIKKFVEQVEQITFSGKMAHLLKQEVLFVTERAVFRMADGQLQLTEYAPGIDVEKDILALLGFPVKLADSLEQMDPRIFIDTRLELANQF